MSNSMQDHLEQAMSVMREQQAAMMRAQRELEKATATARDRVVTVVVGSQGELRDLRFHGLEYRQLPPPKLAALLIELVDKARADMAGKVSAVFAPFAGGGDFIRRSMTGGTELDELLAPLRAMREPGAAHVDEED